MIWAFPPQELFLRDMDGTWSMPRGPQWGHFTLCSLSLQTGPSPGDRCLRGTGPCSLAEMSGDGVLSFSAVAEPVGWGCGGCRGHDMLRNLELDARGAGTLRGGEPGYSVRPGNAQLCVVYGHRVDGPE